MSLKKHLVKIQVAQLLQKAALALFELVKSKLFKRAEAKYCKTLNDLVKKVVDKSDDLIAATDGKKFTAKTIRNLYALKLLADTMETSGEVLIAAAKHINDTVDFTRVIDADVDAPAKEDKKYDELIAEVAGTIEPLDFGCGPDGCEIA